MSGEPELNCTTLQFDLTRDSLDGRVNANHGKVTVILQECRTAKRVRMLTTGKKYQNTNVGTGWHPLCF